MSKSKSPPLESNGAAAQSHDDGAERAKPNSAKVPENPKDFESPPRPREPKDANRNPKTSKPKPFANIFRTTDYITLDCREVKNALFLVFYVLSDLFKLLFFIYKVALSSL